jgi:hypothetical protein
MSLLFFILIFSHVISGDSKVAANDPSSRRHPRVVDVDPSLAATFVVAANEPFIFYFNFSHVISDDSKVAANDPSSAALVAAVDPSLAATFLSPLMSLLFFILIFSLIISGDPFVAANDPSSDAPIRRKKIHPIFLLQYIAVLQSFKISNKF